MRAALHRLRSPIKPVFIYAEKSGLSMSTKDCRECFVPDRGLQMGVLGRTAARGA